ncbi:hypothetical protein JCM8097_008577 [Rhodosporidiobolus ruineniae]
MAEAPPAPEPLEAAPPAAPAGSPNTDDSAPVDTSQPAADESQHEDGKPRPSIYVQAADEMLDAVMDHEAFLFNDHEQRALERWRGMQYQTQYLFMRLFLRKHGQWIRVSALRSAYTTSTTTTTPSSSAKPTPSRQSSMSSPSLSFSQQPSPTLDSPAGPLLGSPTPVDRAEVEGEVKEKKVWPSDITDLDAACEELWERVDLASPSVPPPLPPPAESAAATSAPVAGPSSPRPRPVTPPPAVPPPPAPPVHSASDSVLDLTLTDSDDDPVLDLTTSPVRPARPKPKSAKARGKQPARSLPPPPPPPSPPAKKPPVVLEDELSQVAYSTDDFLAMEEPEGVLGLLSMEELTALGKKMKVKVPTGKSNRAEWTKALLATSTQSTLSFFAAPAPTQQKGSKGKSTGVSTPMKRSVSAGSVGVGYDAKGKKLTQSSVVLKHALAIIGPVIRLHPAYLTLFQRLSLIYHRTSYTAVSTSALTSSLLARFGKRRYPSYTVSRSFALFPSRGVLLAFERAIDTEKRLEECLDGAWAAGVQLGKRAAGAERESKGERMERYARGVRIWEAEAEGEWRALCEEAEKEMNAQEDDEEKRLLYYRRRFHPGWPLTRAAYKAAGCYAKLGQHAREAALHRHLLSQTSFRRGKRGDWYDRLALVLMKYPGTGAGPLSVAYAASGAPKKEEDLDELEEEEEAGERPKEKVKGKKGAVMGKGKGRAKKGKVKKEESDDEEMEDVAESGKGAERTERLLEALEVCKAGLEDPFTHLIYKSSLLRRIARLHSALDLGPPPPELSATLLAKPQQRTMEGDRVDTPTIGKKSVWRLSDGAEGTVEELCLEQYQREGWKGFHSENGVLTMIFALIFWDVIFAPVDGVFETPYQSDPLDLATDAFAVVRRPAITARLAAVHAGEGAVLLGETDDRERPLGTWAVGTNWERFSKEDLVEIVKSLGGPALAAILTVFAEEYGHRTGGIPDLCLWNPSTRRVLFSEIKGPGDTLSETQKVWLDVLLGAAAASRGGLKDEEADDAGDEEAEEQKPGLGRVDVEVVRVVESGRRSKKAKAEDDASDENENEDEDEQGGGKRKKRRKSSTAGPTKARARSRSKSTSGVAAEVEEIELDLSD